MVIFSIAVIILILIEILLILVVGLTVLRVPLLQKDKPTAKFGMMKQLNFLYGMTQMQLIISMDMKLQLDTKMVILMLGEQITGSLIHSKMLLLTRLQQMLLIYNLEMQLMQSQASIEYFMRPLIQILKPSLVLMQMLLNGILVSSQILRDQLFTSKLVVTRLVKMEVQVSTTHL